jgi:hypothetical protein
MTPRAFCGSGGGPVRVSLHELRAFAPIHFPTANPMVTHPVGRGSRRAEAAGRTRLGRSLALPQCKCLNPSFLKGLNGEPVEQRSNMDYRCVANDKRRGEWSRSSRG